MDTLFPIEPKYPKGFYYYPDFITAIEEKELLEFIRNLELHTFIFQGYEAKRKVASFGYDYNFEKRALAKGKEIPSVFHSLVSKVGEKLKIPDAEITELLVTEYPVGSVINWHRDAFPFEMIAGISLMSDCVFKLRPWDKSKQGRGSIISIPVRSRSLYLIKDEARMEWEHSIAPVKSARYSITLRTLKK